MMSEDLTHAWGQLFHESPTWAILPGSLDALAATLARGERMAAGRRSPIQAPTSTAVIPIVGPLVRRGGFISELLGLSSYADIRSALAQAVSDSSVDRILLYIDSPGGAATGCEECADDIARAGSVKPIIAFVDGIAASAGYWLGSQAGEIVATKSAEVGSIGVYLLHVEMSRALDKEGVRPTFIVSKVSPYKTEANPFEVLGSEAKENLQRDIDVIASRFVGQVAKGRSVSIDTVEKQFGRGRMLFASDARRAEMIDRVGSLGDALQTAPASRSARNSRRLHQLKQEQWSATAARRRRLELYRNS